MSCEVPPELYGKIVDRIRKERKNRRIRRAVFSVFSAIASAGGSVFFFLKLRTELASSGLLSYASIVFSDTGTVAQYWKDFLLLLGESIPVTASLAFLGALFVLFGSVGYAIKYTYDKRLV